MLFRSTGIEKSRMKTRILILGIAPCLEEDIALIEDPEDWDKMAIGVDCSDRVLFDIVGAATYHFQEFEQFRIRRQRAGGNLDYVTHSHKMFKGVDMVWPLVAPSPDSGSSSFLGTQAAVELGYKKIILCGCPMIGPPQTGKKEPYDRFQSGWIKYAKPMFGDKVKSMSGWTRDFLGYPTPEWLEKQLRASPPTLITSLRPA